MAIKLDRYFYVLEREEDGGQRIRLLGNAFWSTNNRYLLAAWTFENIPVAVAQMWWTEGFWAARTTDSMAYICDITEAKALDICKTYFDGQAGNELDLMDITVDTPEGCYYFDM